LWSAKAPSPNRPGVETEPDALKSHSVRRLELMMAENHFSFAVELLDPATAPQDTTHSQAIGFLGITQPPDIFYIFDQAHWGKGYATEALKAFLDSYWTTYPDGLPGMDEGAKNVLLASVHDGNVASEAILAKCGFRHAGGGFALSHGKDLPCKHFRMDRPAP